jgi:hypothetical protein
MEDMAKARIVARATNLVVHDITMGTGVRDFRRISKFRGLRRQPYRQGVRTTSEGATMTFPGQRIRLFLLVLIGTTFLGCVRGDVSTFLRYERSDDSFRCLRVYTNIAAIDQGDLDHMAKMWERRRFFIINPFEISIFNTLAFGRTGRNKFYAVSLCEPADVGEEKVTAADLSTIEILPGDFYLNSHGNLSIYHQCVIPGQTLNAIVADLVAPFFAEKLAQFAEEQIQSQGKENVELLTWDVLRQSLYFNITEKGVVSWGPETPKPASPWPMLEKASLRLLMKAGADKTVKITRARDVLTIVVPLSNRDCHEAVATIDLLRDALADRRAAEEKLEIETCAAILDACKLRHLEETGLEVTVDMTRFSKAFPVDVDRQPHESTKPIDFKTTVASIRGRGIEVNKTFAIDKLIAEYRER